MNIPVTMESMVRRSNATIIFIFIKIIFTDARWYQNLRCLNSREGCSSRKNKLVSAEALVERFQPKSQEVELWIVVVEAICKENVHITESGSVMRRVMSASRGELAPRRTGDELRKIRVATVMFSCTILSSGAWHWPHAHMFLSIFSISMCQLIG